MDENSEDEEEADWCDDESDDVDEEDDDEESNNQDDDFQRINVNPINESASAKASGQTINNNNEKSEKEVDEDNPDTFFDPVFENKVTVNDEVSTNDEPNVDLHEIYPDDLKGLKKPSVPERKVILNKENRKNPTMVPRGAKFFLHDDRDASNTNTNSIKGRRQQRNEIDTNRNSTSDDKDDSVWKHDKFLEVVENDDDVAPSRRRRKGRGRGGVSRTNFGGSKEIMNSSNQNDNSNSKVMTNKLDGVSGNKNNGTTDGYIISEYVESPPIVKMSPKRNTNTSREVVSYNNDDVPKQLPTQSQSSRRKQPPSHSPRPSNFDTIPTKQTTSHTSGGGRAGPRVPQDARFLAGSGVGPQDTRSSPGAHGSGARGGSKGQRGPGVPSGRNVPDVSTAHDSRHWTVASVSKPEDQSGSISSRGAGSGTSTPSIDPKLKASAPEFKPNPQAAAHEFKASGTSYMMTEVLDASQLAVSSYGMSSTHHYEHSFDGRGVATGGGSYTNTTSTMSPAVPPGFNYVQPPMVPAVVYLGSSSTTGDGSMSSQQPTGTWYAPDPTNMYSISSSAGSDLLTSNYYIHPPGFSTINTNHSLDANAQSYNPPHGGYQQQQWS